MSSITVGRTLDEYGEPIDGTGFEVDPESDLAERIAERTGPITSHPTRPVWGVPLEAPGETIRTLTIAGPGYNGPPEHYHEQSTEVFEVREGEVTLTLDGVDHAVSAGESETVDTGVVHTFHTAGTDRAVMLTTIRSPGRLRQVLPTLGGLAHDETMDPQNPLQQAIIARRLEGNTTFTAGEGGVAGTVTDALAPLARVAGYDGAYARYAQPAFWERHVEQPEW